MAVWDPTNSKLSQSRKRMSFMSITAFVATILSSVLATVIASWIIKKFMK